MPLLPDHLTLPVAELARAARVAFEVLPDSEALFVHMARSIADEIQANNQAGRPTRLILPVGPIGQYPHLVRLCNQERTSWKKVYTFNMDEYCDWQGRRLPLDHPLSFAGTMRACLFGQLDEALRIPGDQAHFPDPLALEAISERIRQVGGIDTCYGGIGYHGHVAFNEPPNTGWHRVSLDEFRASLTRLVALAPDTIVMNSTWNSGGNPAAMPPMAVTLGMRDILASRRIRLYCSGGAWQRTALRAALLSEPDLDYPVTLLQDHPDCAIFADLDTARPAGISSR